MKTDVTQFLVKPLSDYRHYSVEVIRPAFDRIFDPHLFLIYNEKTLVAEAAAYITGNKLLPQTRLQFSYINEDDVPHEALLTRREMAVYEYTKLCKPSKLAQSMSLNMSIDSLYGSELLINGHTSLIDRIAFYSFALQICGDSWVDHDYFHNKLIKAQSEFELLKQERKGL